MDVQQRELFTVQEAAAIWGISRQAIYQRLNKLTSEGFTTLQGKKRYITKAGIEAYREVVKQVEQPLSTIQPISKAELDNLKTQLQEALTKVSSLQATVEAQQAHISSLQAALDKAQTALNQEQTLHMATMQQRLPSGRGGGLFAWLKGKGQHGQ